MDQQNSAATLASYNLWANQQFINWLSAKSIEQLNKEIPSSFNSMLKTLNHIWAIEEYWYSVICRNEDFVNRYGLENLDAGEIFNGIINRSAVFANKIPAFTESQLQEQINVVSPWFEANLTRRDYIQHLVNHSTYHRGQVVTIGRNAGITDAPMTDYLFYCLATSGK